MANRLSTKGIATAFAAVTAIVYIVCLVIVLAMGDAALKFFNLFVHGIDLTGLKTNPNIGNGILGLIISVIAAYVFGWIFAVVNNRFSK